MGLNYILIPQNNSNQNFENKVVDGKASANIHSPKIILHVLRTDEKTKATELLY